MYVSEYSFDHLRRAADERFARELEFRRRASENAVQRTPVARGGLRAVVRRLVHPGRASVRRLSHP